MVGCLKSLRKNSKRVAVIIGVVVVVVMTLRARVVFAKRDRFPNTKKKLNLPHKTTDSDALEDIYIYKYKCISEHVAEHIALTYSGEDEIMSSAAGSMDVAHAFKMCFECSTETSYKFRCRSCVQRR